MGRGRGRREGEGMEEWRDGGRDEGVKGGWGGWDGKREEEGGMDDRACLFALTKESGARGVSVVRVWGFTLLSQFVFCGHESLPWVFCRERQRDREKNRERQRDREQERETERQGEKPGRTTTCHRGPPESREPPGGVFGVQSLSYIMPALCVPYSLYT